MHGSDNERKTLFIDHEEDGRWMERCGGEDGTRNGIERMIARAAPRLPRLPRSTNTLV